MRKITLKTKLISFLILAILTTVFAKIVVSNAASTNLSGGDILAAKNLTNSDTTYTDPINGKNGDHIRMRVRVVDQGTEDAQNVTVKFNLSNGTSPSVTISADNASSQTDIVNVNPGGQSLSFIPGTGLKYGPPSCSNGCAVDDSIVTNGVNIGNLAPGEIASYQLSIEANIVGDPVSTQKPVFRSGNIFDGGNRTTRVVDWQDPIPADPGQVIEFRTQIINDGTGTANNVSVRADLPIIASNSMKATTFVTGSGADSVSDIATVNVLGSTPQTLVYLPGHTRMFGPGCNSGDGCSLPDGISVHGISIGSVAPGVTNSVQVLFKAYVSNQVTPSPTPTATPTMSPSPRPTATPTATPTITPTPSPTPSSTGSFMLCKFNDQNGNGSQDSGEPGLSWNFVYNINGGAWQQYQTSANWWDIFNTNQGCGSVITVPAGSTIWAQENSVTGWSATTASQISFTIPTNQTLVEKFGNEQVQATVTPTPSPTTVPSSPTSSCTSLTATTTSGTAPLTVSFTGNGSDSAGNLQAYQFNFGDNSNNQDQIVTTTGTQASHVYNNSGNFTATLIVKDSRGVWVGGNPGNCQLSINVNGKPQVLGASAPPAVLPKTGSNDGFYLTVASIPTIIGGIYLYRKFRLV